ncbi:MAG TPA: nickel pincer cofactor biosynthesis protein LarC [Kofleriaceae bacterium]|nr:nickel pincer cofactor biosynthesis protein LarC [Kofleriaceae bacterium]
MTSITGRHLHIDCASGAAGDMLLGALIDLGVPVAVIGDALDAIGAGRDRLRLSKVIKHGVAALDIKVDTAGHLDGEAHSHHQPHAHSDHAHQDHAHHDHAHHDHAHGDDAHGDHPHVHYAAIRQRVLAAKLTDGTRRRALDIFDRLARAEAKMHGMSADDVVFHEVGAVDSVVDVVGTAAALDWLAPREVTCTSVAMGHGTLRCAHGVLPVPAPAALEVLREAGGIVADGGIARELCTPTGAAVLAATVTRWSAAPTGQPLAVGWGAGDAELADRANVLRVVAIDVGAALRGQADAVWQLDANIDDMSPELCGPASEAVFAAGALDAWWTPITMKKGRPALMLSALATDETRAAVAAAMLRETTTIGVRYARRERTILARTIREVATAYGPIAVKVACDGDAVVNVAPELDACVAAARHHGVPVKLVFAAAVAAYEATR